MTTPPVTIAVALFHHDSTVAASFRASLDSERDFVLTVYDNALVGLAGLSRNPPTLVVAAVDLPIIDGFQLCRLMRSPEYPALHSIPMVLMGKESVTTAHRAKELGAIDFLGWPNRANVLSFSLRRAAASARLQSAPAVFVVSSHAPVVEAVTQACADEQKLEVLPVETLAQVREQVQGRALEMVVVDSSDGARTREVIAWTLAQQPRIPVLVANTSPPNPGEARAYIEAGACDVVQALGRHADLGNGCRHHLRRARSQGSTPKTREDIVACFFEAAECALLVVQRRTGRILAVNDAAIAALGQPRTDLEHTGLSQALPAEARPSLPKAMEDLVRSNSSTIFDVPAGRLTRVVLTRLEWADLVLVALMLRPPPAPTPA